MTNTNISIMDQMTVELEAFKKLMGKDRTVKARALPDIENEETEELETPSDILNRAQLLMMMAFLEIERAMVGTKCMEEEFFGEETDSPSCDMCLHDNDCNQNETMILVARPNGNNTIMTLDKAKEEIGDISFNMDGDYDIKPVPGTRDLYYMIPEKRPLAWNGKTYYKAPAVIFGIDEKAGEVTSPNVRQLYTAAEYFENASTSVRTREGEKYVFCFD